MESWRKHMKKNHTTYFLIGSLILVLAICIAVFVFQTKNMNRKSAGTMNEIGETYMEGMSQQIAMHFGTIMEMKLSQVAAF